MLLIFLFQFAFAQTPSDSNAVINLPAMTLKSKTRNIPSGPIQDKKIISGKKVTTVESEDVPVVPNNSYRQTLAEIPGLLTSEVNNESYISMTNRGLGDPHEGFNILMLRNGIPSAADPYGYPAAYYSPSTDSISKVEFYRGGAGLLYGPQPGGALNFILKQAPKEWRALEVKTINLGGSFGRYSTYTEASGAGEKSGYLGSFHARGGEGFREQNSRSSVINPRLNFQLQTEANRRFYFDLDYYQGTFGEPGGLGRVAATNVLTIDDDYRKSTLTNDKLKVSRSSFSVAWEEEISAQQSTLATVWIAGLSRNSYRQALGGSPTYGGIALGTTNTIQKQDFQTVGLDLRYLNKYNLWGEENYLSVALTATSTKSPFQQETGASADATSGSKIKDIDRATSSQAIAIENSFVKGDFTVTPGIRFENIGQKIEENLNVGSAVPLRNADQKNSVKLLGLGLQYQINPDVAAYANLSEGYKPPAFQDTVPLSTGDTISEDISEARTWSRELGVRGTYKQIESDLSIYEVDYSNQFGRVGTKFTNIGASKSKGLDLLLAAPLAEGLSFHFGGAWLQSEILTGASAGKPTQYSPSSIIRTGLRYSYSIFSHVSLQNQWVANHSGDDAGTANFDIPAYELMDISGQQYLGSVLGSSKTHLIWGIQNALDKKYYSRIRSNGIEPGQPRSFYVGASLAF